MWFVQYTGDCTEFRAKLSPLARFSLAHEMFCTAVSGGTFSCRHCSVSPTPPRQSSVENGFLCGLTVCCRPPAKCSISLQHHPLAPLVQAKSSATATPLLPVLRALSSSAKWHFYFYVVCSKHIINISTLART